MNKQSKIIISSLLICFIIILSVALTFTATPSINRTVKKYLSKEYSHGSMNTSAMKMHSFSKDGESVLIIWYKNKKIALKAQQAAAKLGQITLMRGNAVAVGTKNAVELFSQV